MTVNFYKSGESVGVENFNGAILFVSALNPQITINLPADYTAGNYIIGLNTVGIMAINLILNNTVITNNQITLANGQTTGTAIFRAYPNIMPFKNWLQVLWATNGRGNVQCDIKKNNGATVVDTNISNPKDISGEQIGLEYVDFVFTLSQVSGNIPILQTVEFQFQGGL